jgi:hypothetical protein
LASRWHRSSIRDDFNQDSKLIGSSFFFDL